jgi:hypothetical protein
MKNKAAIASHKLLNKTKLEKRRNARIIAMPLSKPLW